MIITPDLEYPIVCINVRRGFDGRSLKLDMINLNSSASWYVSKSFKLQWQSRTSILNQPNSYSKKLLQHFLHIVLYACSILTER